MDAKKDKPKTGTRRKTNTKASNSTIPRAAKKRSSKPKGTRQKTNEKASNSARPRAAKKRTSKPKGAVGGNRIRKLKVPVWQHKISHFLLAPKEQYVLHFDILNKENECCFLQPNQQYALQSGIIYNDENQGDGRKSPTCTASSAIDEANNMLTEPEESTSSDEDSYYDISDMLEVVLTEYF